MKTKKTVWVIFIIFFLAIPSTLVLPKVLYKPKVFDCFPFFNELDVLEIRLNELYDTVDRFVLVESTKGYLNTEKPLYFLQNKERFAKYLDKIEHVIVDEFPEFSPVGEEDYWEVENFQRNQIMKGLKRCKPHPRDIVIITDCDEIIRKNKIKHIVRSIDKKKNDIVFGEFDWYKFFLNRKLDQKLRIVVATSWHNLSKYIQNAQLFRNLSGFAKGHAFNGFEVLEAAKKQYPKKKWAFARMHDLGWHFQSVGTHSHYLQKVHSYAHLSINTEENKNIENIRKAIEMSKWEAIDETFPEYVIANKDKPEFQIFIDQPTTIYR